MQLNPVKSIHLCYYTIISSDVKNVQLPNRQ